MCTAESMGGARVVRANGAWAVQKEGGCCGLSRPEKGGVHASNEWIYQNYLKLLPRYDPQLYTLTAISAHRAVMEFATAFCLLIFLSKVMNHFVYDGVAWNTLEVSRLDEQRFQVAIEVSSHAELNRLKVRIA